MPICPNCAKEIRLDDSFCSSCGQDWKDQLARVIMLEPGENMVRVCDCLLGGYYTKSGRVGTLSRDEGDYLVVTDKRLVFVEKKKKGLFSKKYELSRGQEIPITRIAEFWVEIPDEPLEFFLVKVKEERPKGKLGEEAGITFCTYAEGALGEEGEAQEVVDFLDGIIGSVGGGEGGGEGEPVEEEGEEGERQE